MRREFSAELRAANRCPSTCPGVIASPTTPSATGQADEHLRADARGHDSLNLRAPQGGNQAWGRSLPTMMTVRLPQVKRIAETWGRRLTSYVGTYGGQDAPAGSAACFSWAASGPPPSPSLGSRSLRRST